MAALGHLSVPDVLARPSAANALFWRWGETGIGAVGGGEVAFHEVIWSAAYIDTLKECDVTGVTRLAATTWDETWGVMMRAVAQGLAREK